MEETKFPAIVPTGIAHIATMTDKNSLLAAICWTTTAILTGFMCFAQAGMMVSMLLGRAGIACAAPAGLALALIVGHLLSKQIGLTPRQRIWPPLLALIVIAAGLAFS